MKSSSLRLVFAFFLGYAASGYGGETATLGQSREEIIAVLGAPSPEPPGKMIIGQPAETLTYLDLSPPRYFTFSEGTCVGLNYFKLSGDQREVQALLEQHAKGSSILKIGDGLWKCEVPPWQAKLQKLSGGQAILVFTRWHNDPK